MRQLKAYFMIPLMGLMLMGTNNSVFADVKEGDRDLGEDLYSAILDVYSEGYQSYMNGTMSWEEEQTLYAANSVFEPYDLHGSDFDGAEYHRDLGYAFYDLNEDNVPELLLQSYPGDGESDFYGYDAIYTMQDGAPVLLDNSWYRDQLYLLENGCVTHELSAGSMTYVVEVFELQGCELFKRASEDIHDPDSQMAIVNGEDGRYIEEYYPEEDVFLKTYYYLPSFYHISEYA